MSLPKELLEQAKLLATKEARRPKQASLRRAVSASYYALFHLLVDEASRRLVGGAKNRVALRTCLGRAFSHGTMKTVARQFAASDVSKRLRPGLNGQPVQEELVRVARAFVGLQQHRHEADYDLGRRFTRVETLSIASDAKRAFADWQLVRGSPQADTFLVGLLTYDRMHP